ncbi:hypothetical protein U1Q18_001620 [Sarracenia purpurea var. burkii]
MRVVKSTRAKGLRTETQEVVPCDNIPTRNITSQVIGGISQPEVVVEPVASSVSEHSEDRKSHLSLELKEGNEEGSEEDDNEAEEGETDGTNEADGSDDYESGTSEEIDDDEDIEGGGEANIENSVCPANKEDNQVRDSSQTQLEKLCPVANNLCTVNSSPIECDLLSVVMGGELKVAVCYKWSSAHVMFDKLPEKDKGNIEDKDVENVRGKNL